MKTAQAILDRSKDRFESGVVVESDYLSAQVRLATRKQELIHDQNNLALARAQLSTAMGCLDRNQFDPTDALAERDLPAASLEEAEKQAMEMRPDLKRVRSEEAAQQQSVAIAKSAFGPRVNAFAGWEADNPTFLAGGGGNNWLAGVEVQIDLFEGGAKRAQLSREQAMQEKVAAAKEMASDAVRMEVRRAYYDVDAARQQIEVARATIAESQESLRINQNRYDSGLSTITDLLAAEEAARRSQTDYWEAVYRYHTGYANLELASGTLNPQSPGGDAMKYKNQVTTGILVLIAVLSGGLSGCSNEHRAEPAATETVSNVPVIVAQKTTVPDWLEAVGTMRAAQTSQVSSQMMGTIIEIRSHEGDRVQSGQVLATIDDAQPRSAADQATAALAVAENEVSAADSDLVLAQATLARYQQLYDKKSVSPQEFDEIKARYQSAEARRDMARAGKAQASAALTQAQTSLSYTQIRAPFSGVVTEKKADAGTLVSPGMPIFTLEDTRSFRLEVTVDENDIHLIHVGQVAPVSIDGLGEYSAVRENRANRSGSRHCQP